MQNLLISFLLLCLGTATIAGCGRSTSKDKSDHIGAAQLRSLEKAKAVEGQIMEAHKKRMPD